MLFLTLEGSFGLYCLAASVRSFMARRTVGLLLRPGPAVTGKTLRLRLKRFLLKQLRRAPRVETLTILPFSVDLRFAEIADGWIHDPQLWDLSEEERRRTEEAQGTLSKQIRAVAGGRRVVLALGRQDESKGFDWFADLYAKSANLRRSMLFACGGQVHPKVAAHLSAFIAAGGFACNRFVTDDELLELYGAADLIWCAYAPSYDQASGILGRAAQLGIPAVVRRGSLIHRMCEIEEISYVAIDQTTDWQQLISAPAHEDTAKTTARVRRMSVESLQRLREALGVTT
jgi:hypothetical protein